MSFIILFIVLFIAFICGDNVLGALGYPHGDIDASSLFRLHPLTYLAFFLIIYFVITGKVKFADLFDKMKNEFVFLIVCLIIISYLHLIGRLNAISFFFDALVLPVMLSILLKLTSKKLLYRFQNFIYFFFFLNTVIAIEEKIVGVNLIVREPAWQFEYFRSSAIFGHPLNNGLIMSILTVILFWATKNTWLKLSVLFSGMLSIFCFGARGALIGIFLGIILNIILNAIGLGKGKANKRIANGIVYLGIFAIIIGFVINFTGLGDRISALSHVDNSAEARMDSFRMFNGQDLNEILWGGYSVSKIEILQYQNDVEIIENFYVVWILKFGLIMTVLLFCTLVKFLFSIMTSVALDIKVPILVTLFFVASTNNSLSSNSLVLAIVVLSYYILYEGKKENQLSILLNKI